MTGQAWKTSILFSPFVSLLRVLKGSFIQKLLSVLYMLAWRWTMTSFQQQLSHRHHGGAPLGQPIILHGGNCTMQQLGWNRCQGPCVGKGFFYLDSGLSYMRLLITLQPAEAVWNATVAHVSHMPCAEDRPCPENGDHAKGFLYCCTLEICGLG